MNRSRTIGTRWESAIVDHLRDNGVPHAERRALNGANDRGDIAGLIGVVVEAKAEQKLRPAGWIAELLDEMANDKAHVGFVWAKRVGRTHPENGYILTTPAVMLRLLTEAGYIEGQA
jgi:hypothetical protein